MLSGTAMVPCEHDAVLELLGQCDLIIVNPKFSPAIYGMLHPAPMDALASTLSTIRQRNSNVGILVILPYFLQESTLEAMPYLHMLEYRVRTSRLCGNEQSRIFTNLPLACIPSPQEAGYLLCFDCNDWMFNTKTHCKLCNTCHSEGFRPWGLACRVGCWVRDVMFGVFRLIRVTRNCELTCAGESATTLQ